jgi:hypothetical protein
MLKTNLPGWLPRANCHIAKPFEINASGQPTGVVAETMSSLRGLTTSPPGVLTTTAGPPAPTEPPPMPASPVPTEAGGIPASSLRAQATRLTVYCMCEHFAEVHSGEVQLEQQRTWSNITRGGRDACRHLRGAFAKSDVQACQCVVAIRPVTPTNRGNVQLPLVCLW